MLFSEIKTRVKRQFGDESGALIDDLDITRWANDGQVDIIRKTDALMSLQSTVVTLGTTNVTLPTDFLFAKKVVMNQIPLELVSFSEGFITSTSYSQNSAPGTCYVWNNKLYFNAEQAKGSVQLYYNRRPAALVVDADIPEIPVQMHEDLVRFCIARAKELNEDMEGAGLIMSDYNQRVNLARSEISNPDSNSYNAIRTLPGDGGNEYW